MGKGDGDEGKRLERVVKLLEAFREVQARQYEIVEELQRVVAGERSIASRSVEALKIFGAAWSKRYGVKWQHGGAKDGALAKRLVQNLEDEDIAQRIAQYIRSEDPFYKRDRHPFSLFCVPATLNRFANVTHENLELAGESLTRDADATQRYLDELRGGVQRGKL